MDSFSTVQVYSPIKWFTIGEDLVNHGLFFYSPSIFPYKMIYHRRRFGKPWTLFLQSKYIPFYNNLPTRKIWQTMDSFSTVQVYSPIKWFTIGEDLVNHGLFFYSPSIFPHKMIYHRRRFGKPWTLFLQSKYIPFYNNLPTRKIWQTMDFFSTVQVYSPYKMIYHRRRFGKPWTFFLQSKYSPSIFRC
jgi:hypothetical protein